MGVTKFVPMEKESIEIAGVEYPILIQDPEALERAMATLKGDATPKQIAAFIDELIPGLPPEVGAFDKMRLSKIVLAQLEGLAKTADPTPTEFSETDGDNKPGSPPASKGP